MDELENITNEEQMQQEETSAAIVQQEEPVVEEEPIPVPEKKYIIRIKDGNYLKAWSPFELCKRKADAGVFNEDWARGNAQRLRAYKNLSCEVIEL